MSPAQASKVRCDHGAKIWPRSGRSDFKTWASVNAKVRAKSLKNSASVLSPRKIPDRELHHYIDIYEYNGTSNQAPRFYAMMLQANWQRDPHSLARMHGICGCPRGGR